MNSPRNPSSHSSAEHTAALTRRVGSALEFQQLGDRRLAAGDAAGAIAAYEQCLTFEIRNAGVQNNYGVALLRCGRFAQSVAAFEMALDVQPGYQRPLVNLGRALRELGRLPEALTRLRQALDHRQDYPPALVNLGDTLAAAGELAAAQDALEKAIRVAPSLLEAHMTLGIVLQQRGQLAAAIESLRRALDLSPDHADSHANLGHVLFCSGDWEAAWPHFEYRFRRAAQRSPLAIPAGMTRWDGTVNPDLELWLIGEQGLGDQIQFARYARVLADRGVRSVIHCDRRLVTLLAGGGLGSEVRALGAPAEVGGTRRWMPLMSLPAWHRTGPESVPLAARYLSAQPDRVTRWRERLPGPEELRVALAWAGNAAMETGRYAGRSPPLEALAPLFAVPGVRYLSLQKGDAGEQLTTVANGAAILSWPDLDAGPDAFLDTAAVLACVDLLVTSDTAIAHLAGALGIPTWLCLMHEPDWRWMRAGPRTPWYASMRVFRQPAAGDWASVYAEVADGLARRRSESNTSR